MEKIKYYNQIKLPDWNELLNYESYILISEQAKKLNENDYKKWLQQSGDIINVALMNKLMIPEDYVDPESDFILNKRVIESKEFLKNNGYLNLRYAIASLIDYQIENTEEGTNILSIFDTLKNKSEINFGDGTISLDKFDPQTIRELLPAKTWYFLVKSGVIRILQRYDTGATSKIEEELILIKKILKIDSEAIINLGKHKINDFQGSIELNKDDFHLTDEGTIGTNAKGNHTVNIVDFELVPSVDKINSFKDSVELSENSFIVNDEGEIETIFDDDIIKELDHKFVKRKYQTTYTVDDKNYDVDKVFISNSNSHYVDIKNKWVNADDETDIRETRLHIVAKDGEILGINTDGTNNTPINVVSASALATKEYVDTHGGGLSPDDFTIIEHEPSEGTYIKEDDFIVNEK